MISKKLAIEVLNVYLSTGADYAEIFYEDSHTNNVSLENGKVETSASNSLNGVGLRLLKENQCIYGYTNDLTRKGLLALANSLNKSFNGKQIVFVDHLDKVKAKERSKIVVDNDTIALEDKIALLKSADAEILKANDPRIVRRICSLNCWHRGVEYLTQNQNGSREIINGLLTALLLSLLMARALNKASLVEDAKVTYLNLKVEIKTSL